MPKVSGPRAFGPLASPTEKGRLRPGALGSTILPALRVHFGVAGPSGAAGVPADTIAEALGLPTEDVLKMQ